MEVDIYLFIHSFINMAGPSLSMTKLLCIGLTNTHTNALELKQSHKIKQNRKFSILQSYLQSIDYFHNVALKTFLKSLSFLVICR